MNFPIIKSKPLNFKNNLLKQFLLLVILFFSVDANACNKSSATLISETDNGNGTYTYVVNVCLELGDMIGVPNTFTLTPSGGTYTSMSTTTPASFNNSGTIYNKSVAGSVISYTTTDMFPNSTPNVWCVPQVTFTTNGRPSKITVNTSDLYGAATCDHVLTIPSCTPPTTPTITSVTATCLSPGTSTISNYSVANTYTFTPVGPTVGAGGSISGMTTGTSYTVTASAGGCNSTASASFSNAAQLAAPTTPTATLTQPTCSTPTGTINITAPIGALTYNNNGGAFQAGTSFSGLSPATYTIIVKNASGCTSTANFTINAVPGGPVTPTATLTQPTCSTPTGTIVITAPLGAYTYNINGGAFQAGTSFSGLAPNTYTVIAKDAGGCTSTTNFTINAVPSNPTAPTTTLTQPTCLLSTGTITISSPTGVGYTYSIDGTTFQAGTSFSGLSANTFTITVKNAAGCTSTGTATLSNPPGAPAAASTTITQPTCTLPTGTITISSPIGVGLTYSTDGITYQAGTTFSGLTPNNYTVSVKDAGGCTSSATAVVNPTPAAPTAPTTNITQPTCLINTGTIDVTTPVGVGYTYSINGITFQASTSFPTLAANTYTVTVKDANGCTSIGSSIINPPAGAPSPATTSITQPTCILPTGTISITSPLGVALTYSIDGTTYQAGSSFSGLAPATYTVSVKDGVGCISTANAVISAPPGAPAPETSTITQPDCITSTGSITVTAPVGVGFTYSIDGITFQAGTSFSGLTPATYTVTVKDGSGCTSTNTEVINTPPSIPSVATTTITQPTCSTPSGTATITSPTGVGYTYSINGVTFQASTIFSGLAPNNYTITVKNASGCTSTSNTVINAIPSGPSSPTFTATQPTCLIQTGAINITAPIGAYTYSIDGVSFQNGTVFNGLAPGNYTITAKDINGCTSTSAAKINAIPPNPSIATTNVTQPTCQISTGTIFITAPLGAYTYSVDGINFQATTTFNALPANTIYNVTVKDVTGCISTTQATINASLTTPIIPTTSITHASCSSPTGSFTVTSPVGAAYSYSIDGVNFQLGATFTSLNPNTYNLTVKNSSGCTSSNTVTINIPSTPPSAPFSIPKHPTCFTNLGEINLLSPLGATLSYSIDSLTYR